MGPSICKQKKNIGIKTPSGDLLPVSSKRVLISTVVACFEALFPFR